MAGSGSAVAVLVAIAVTALGEPPTLAVWLMASGADLGSLGEPPLGLLMTTECLLSIDELAGGLMMNSNPHSHPGEMNKAELN